MLYDPVILLSEKPIRKASGNHCTFFVCCLKQTSSQKSHNVFRAFLFLLKLWQTFHTIILNLME